VANVTRKIKRTNERQEYYEFCSDWLIRANEQHDRECALARVAGRPEPLAPQRPTFKQWKRAVDMFKAQRAIEIRMRELAGPQSKGINEPDLEWDEELESLEADLAMDPDEAAQIHESLSKP
jgi:hypothetical protein